MNNNYCVIMAGGIGSRFWPLSRTYRPKQFLDILGTGKSLLRQTFDRFNRVVPKENIYIVTNVDYGRLVLESLPEISAEQVLLEPMRRNTAPCIAYANYKIKKINPHANIVVAPSDHLISKEDEFIEVVTKALDFVKQNKVLLTLGIQPSRIETGYGYIQINGGNTHVELNKSFRKVKTFTEKPDYKMAKFFFESKEFYWNSGIFFWSLDSILSSFGKHLPEVDNAFREGEEFYGTGKEEEFINNTYPQCKNISIDYGVMEKADNVYVMCSDFGWSDLGTWGSLHDNSVKDNKNNMIKGKNVMQYDISNCLVNVPDDKLVVVHGLNGFIVVESEGTLLICKKKDEQKIKQFVNDIQLKNGDKYI